MSEQPISETIIIQIEISWQIKKDDEARTPEGAVRVGQAAMSPAALPPRSSNGNTCPRAIRKGLGNLSRCCSLALMDGGSGLAVTPNLDVGRWLILDATTGERITFGMKKDQARDIADNVVGPVVAMSEVEYDRMTKTRGRTKKRKRSR
jgi:hypothetical protein